jgi:hypothetical protein
VPFLFLQSSAPCWPIAEFLLRFGDQTRYAVEIYPYQFDGSVKTRIPVTSKRLVNFSDISGMGSSSFDFREWPVALNQGGFLGNGCDDALAALRGEHRCVQGNKMPLKYHTL